jgi:hypothetical protein
LGSGLGSIADGRRPTAPLDRRRLGLARRRPATKSVERGRGHSTVGQRREDTS